MLKRLLLALLLLGGIQHPSQAALSASDLVNRTRTLLKDANATANRQQFSDAQYLAWASDGQREANALNWLLQYSFAINLTQTTVRYPADSSCMMILRVWFTQAGSSLITKLDSTSMDQLDAQTPGWLNATGVPINYYIDRRGGFNIGFYPIPTVALSTGTAIVTCIADTQDLTSLSDVPFNDDQMLHPYLSALTYYMAYRAYLTLEENDLASTYYKEWLNFLTGMRQGVFRQPDFNPPAGALRNGAQGGVGGP